MADDGRGSDDDRGSHNNRGSDDDRGSDDARLAAIARHALHDEELIAAFASEDLDDAETDRARALVDRCAPCRELHVDLTMLRTAIQASGSAEQRAGSITAPRDFRLTVADAARLRPGSPIARVAERLGFRARLGLGIAAFGKPLGAAMATFGVVGLLLGSLTLGGTPFAAMSGGAGAAASPVPEAAGNPSAPEATGVRANYGPQSTEKDTSIQGPQSGGRDTAAGPGSGSFLVIGLSLALLAIGIGLILAARRNVSRISAPNGN